MRRVLWMLICVSVFLSPVVVAQQTEILLPDGAVARLDLGTVYALAYSPDGQILAVATSLGVELHRADPLGLVRILEGHTGHIYTTRRKGGTR